MRPNPLQQQLDQEAERRAGLELEAALAVRDRVLPLLRRRICADAAAMNLTHVSRVSVN